MGKSAFSGPLVVFGQQPVVNGMSPDYNTHAGPSMFYTGVGLLDPRVSYQEGQPNTTIIPGFVSDEFCVVDQAPSTIATDNLAALQVPVAGTALTLVSASGAGITVGVSINNAVTGAAVTVLAIDGAAGQIAFGTSSGPIAGYDPKKAVARNARITSAGDDRNATFLVSGYDIYGYPMSERITGSNATVANGKKAFKYIVSVVPAGTVSGSNVSVGTGDVYGFPLRVDQFAFARIFWNSALITATTGFTAAVTTDPATTTTGDVRGTYATQSASDGTKKLQVFVTPEVANLGSNTGLFGIAQV